MTFRRKLKVAYSRGLAVSRPITEVWSIAADEIADNAACLKNAEKYLTRSLVFPHIATVSKIVFLDIFFRQCGFMDAVRICGPGSMKRLSVRLSVRLSFHSSTTATAAGGFAAGRPADRRY